VRIPALLREDVGFRRFWCSQTASLAGDQVSMIALPLVGVIVLHAGPGGMGLLTAAGWAPNLLLSLHAGAWVDRSGRPREAMIAADLGRAALLVTVPVAWALGALSFAQLVAVAFATGALGALASVAYGSLYGVLVDRERLVEAGALVNGSRAGASVAGPSVGGLLVAIFTAPFAVLADAASFIASAWWLRRVAVPRRAHDADPGGLADGVRFIARSPLVRPILAATATLNVFTFAISALFVLYATRSLGVSPATLGIVLGAGAIGGVLGSVVTGRIVGRIGVGAAFAAGCVLFTAPLLLIPAASGPQPAVLALLFLAEFGAGFGVMVLDISAGAILVAAVPETLRARMFGAYQLVNYGVRPIGALGGGALGAAIGLQPTLWIAGVGAVAGVLWLLPSPVPRMRALPET
jgi:predicted MFS family arabinose efflux permease